MKSPKEIYLHARKLQTRFEEGEKILVRPYNNKLKKFVKNPSEYDEDMFMWGIAYLRNILKRSPKVIIEQYEENLEKQLFKFFESWSIYNYSRAIKRKLPEELHNRALLEAIGGDRWLRKYLDEYGGTPKAKRYSGGHLSKPREIHNYLVDHPLASTEEIIKELWKKGIIIKKNMVTKIKAEFNV